MTLLSPLPPDDKPLAWRKWFTQLKSSVDGLLNREEVSIEGLATEAELEAQAAASLAALEQSVSTLEDFFLEDDGAGGVRIKQDLLEVTQGQIDGGSLIKVYTKSSSNSLLRANFYDTEYDFFRVSVVAPAGSDVYQMIIQNDNAVASTSAQLVSEASTRWFGCSFLPMSMMSHVDSRVKIKTNNTAGSNPQLVSVDWVVESVKEI